MVNQGRQLSVTIFVQLKKQGKRRVFEAKLMLVDEPGAGKPP
jgi:hypothetical protein